MMVGKIARGIRINGEVDVGWMPAFAGMTFAIELAVNTFCAASGLHPQILRRRIYSTTADSASATKAWRSSLPPSR